jgi:chromosome segregation ATPase
MDTMTKGSALEAAVAAERKAAGELAAVQVELAEAQAEVDRVTAEIANAPARDLERLAVRREGLRAKCEVFQNREEHAQTVLSRAEDDVAQVRASANRARLEELLAAARAKDGALSERIRAFRAELLRGIADLNRLLDEAAAIEFPGQHRHTGFGLRWADVDGPSAFKIAANLFPVGR